MRYFFFYLLILLLPHSEYASGSSVSSFDLPDKGVASPGNNHLMEPGVNYQKFRARVSDKDDSTRVLKMKVENNNTKFFRAGDVVYFRIGYQEDTKPCKAFVRDVEDFYFTIHVDDFASCWEAGKYFRRGTILSFQSTKLEDRVLEATQYRKNLILRKDDYLKQLNEVNHFLWSFDQQKLKLSAKYDEEVLEVEKRKEQALSNLRQYRKEQALLQHELKKKLDQLDESLKYYRVERQELFSDRWNQDHDTGLPLSERPQKMKKK